jgi:polyphosphate kinase 2 (PPK2 family)
VYKASVLLIEAANRKSEIFLNTSGLHLVAEISCDVKQQSAAKVKVIACVDRCGNGGAIRNRIEALNPIGSVTCSGSLAYSASPGLTSSGAE